MFFVVPSIFMDCYMGSWSDRFGRKLTLVLPPTGAFLSTVVYAVMGKNEEITFRPSEFPFPNCLI